MSAPEFTRAEKLKAVQQEIIRRNRVYGQHTKKPDARREIDLMKAIARDYQDQPEPAAITGNDPIE